MNIERSLLLLIATIMATVLTLSGLVFWTLYETDLEAERGHMLEILRHELDFIGAVSSFDKEFSWDYPGGSRQATLSQIETAVDNEFGYQSGMSFSFGRRDGNQIEYIARNRQQPGNGGPASMPVDSERAEAMRRAVNGHSGTMIGVDYLGRPALLAYGYSEKLDIGVVFARSLQALRAPYYRAGSYVAIAALILLLLSGWIIYRFISPVIRRIHSSESRHRALLEQMMEAVLVVDNSGIIRFANASAARILNRPTEGIIGSEFGSPVVSHEASEIRILNDDDRFGTADMRATEIDWQGEKAMLVTLHDVTDYKDLQARLMHDALHDALTTLPNRTLFLDRLQIVLNQSKRSRGCPGVVVFLDLDNFKLINDSLSHEVGDRVLVKVAERLQENLREGDTVARFGGDEFVILLEQLADSNEAISIVHRVLESFREPFQVEGQSLRTSASAGMVFLPGDGSGSDLLRDADAAMYRAKHDRQGDLVIFDENMHKEATYHLSMQSDLRDALENEEFFLNFHPIVELDTGRVLGLEALVRWLRKGEPVTPDTFIPLAETIGLILPLGIWIMEESCRRLSAWTTGQQGDTRHYLSVNLSARQISVKEHCRELLEIVRKSRVPPELLRVEVTESALMQSRQHIIPWLQELRDMGIRICLDDFGTGYSSLSYLQQLPIDILKIDKSFVTGMVNDPQRQNMVTAIITLAGQLDIEVIAEGIEHEAERSLLLQRGCRYGQGFLFSKPLAAEEVSEILRRDTPA